MWTKLVIATVLASTPSLAFANHHGDARRTQSHADTARKSAAQHAAKGNTGAADRMNKIAADRQRQADLKAKRAADKDKRKR